MIGDAFVFDAVTHLYNMSSANVKNSGGQMFNQHLYGFHSALTPQGDKVLSQQEFLRDWDIDTITEVVFGQSNTDMLVAQPLPSPISFTTASPSGRSAPKWPGGSPTGSWRGAP